MVNNVIVQNCGIVRKLYDIDVLGRKYKLQSFEGGIIVDNCPKNIFKIDDKNVVYRIDIPSVDTLEELLLTDGINGQVYIPKNNLLFTIVDGIVLKTKFSADLTLNPAIVTHKDTVDTVLHGEGRNLNDLLIVEGDIFNNRPDLYDYLGEQINLRIDLISGKSLCSSVLVYDNDSTAYYWKHEIRENVKQIFPHTTNICTYTVEEAHRSRFLRSLILEVSLAKIEQNIIEKGVSEQEFEYYVFTTKFLREYFLNAENKDFLSFNSSAIKKYESDLFYGMKDFVQARVQTH